MFSQEEELSKDDAWLVCRSVTIVKMPRYCRHCKKHQQAVKQMSLWRLPKYAVFHLKVCFRAGFEC